MNHNNSTINNNTASSSSSSLSLGQQSFLSFKPQPLVSDTGRDNVGVSQENYRKKRSKRIVIGCEEDDSVPAALKPPRSITKKPAESSIFTSKSTTRPTCSECGKQFMSWKALFGHMRCHPERQWRGMNPPQKLKLQHSDRDRTGLSMEEEIASCLLLLAKGGTLPMVGGVSQPVFPTGGGSGMLHSGEPSVLPDADVSGQLRSDDRRVDCSSYKEVFGSRESTARQRGKSDGGGGGALDLNLPAPVETPTASCSSHIELALDLKLGV